jgi:hypothetical protein
MSNHWESYADSYKPLIATEREQLPLLKYPNDLDFSETIGNTTYTVRSHFNRDANKSLLGIVLRWMEVGTDITEQLL